MPALLLPLCWVNAHSFFVFQLICRFLTWGIFCDTPTSQSDPTLLWYPSDYCVSVLHGFTCACYVRLRFLPISLTRLWAPWLERLFVLFSPASPGLTHQGHSTNIYGVNEWMAFGERDPLIGHRRRSGETVWSQENNMCSSQGKIKRKARCREFTRGGVLWGGWGVASPDPQEPCMHAGELTGWKWGHN